MSDNSVHPTRENKAMQDNVTEPVNKRRSVVEAKMEISSQETQKVQGSRSEFVQKLRTAQKIEERQIVDTVTQVVEALPPPAAPPLANTKRVLPREGKPVKFNQRDAANARMLQERCQQLCLSLFFRKRDPVRSLGFTSSIKGEGKSFLALITAQVLAHDSDQPVTLIECDWEHPSLHEYYGIPSTPGLAEWLRGSCKEDDIRYRVNDSLSIIPAGNGAQDAVKLLKKVQQDGLLKIFMRTRDLYIVDLPPIISTGYGSLAASLLESIVIVVRAQAIPQSMIAETCAQLKGLSVHGIILNQGESRIPRWIRQLL